MTTDQILPSKISFLRGLSGVLLAILFYAVASMVIAFVFFALLTMLGIKSYALIGVTHVVGAIIAMFAARNICDFTIKTYSGRAVFVTTLSINLILVTLGVVDVVLLRVRDASMPWSFLQCIAMAGSSYYWFWRRESETPAIIAKRGETGRAAATTFLGCLPAVFYMGFGLIQFGAIAAEVHSVTRMNGLFIAIASLFLTYIPILGSIVGVLGAKDVWGWQWWQAALLYFGLPLGFYVLAAVLSGSGAIIGRMKRAA